MFSSFLVNSSTRERSDIKTKQNHFAYCFLSASCSLFFSGIPVREMFYWPVAAAAIPSNDRGIMCYSLDIYSWKHGSSLLSWSVFGHINSLCHIFRGWRNGSNYFWHSLNIKVFLCLPEYNLVTPTTYSWLQPPTVISICVLYSIKVGRVGNVAEVMGNAEIAHQLKPSFLASIPTFFREVISINGAGLSVSSLLFGFATKLAYFIGAFGVFLSIAKDLKSKSCLQFLGVLSLACFATTFFMIAAGHYQFGMICCERHITFRQCLVIIGLLTGAAHFALKLSKYAVFSKINNTPAFPIGLIFLAVLAATVRSGSPLIAAYSRYDSRYAINVSNWNSGNSSGDSMIYRQRNDPIVGAIFRPDGVYYFDDRSDWFIKSILNFYHKKSVTFITD